MAMRKADGRVVRRIGVMSPFRYSALYTPHCELNAYRRFVSPRINPADRPKTPDWRIPLEPDPNEVLVPGLL